MRTARLLIVCVCLRPGGVCVQGVYSSVWVCVCVCVCVCVHPEGVGH